MEWLARHLDDWKAWSGWGVLASFATFLWGVRKQKRDELRELLNEVRAELERKIDEIKYKDQEIVHRDERIEKLTEAALKAREISARERLENIAHSTVRKETMKDLRRALRAVHEDSDGCEEFIQGAIERLEQEMALPHINE